MHADERMRQWKKFCVLFPADGELLWARRRLEGMSDFTALFAAAAGPSPALLVMLLAACALFIIFVVLLMTSFKDG